jgi:hypothetical protein
MAESASIAALALDARLSDAARVLGFYIATKGAGEHEIGRDDFRRVLHGSPSKDKVSRALSELELHGYVKRKPGGRGHADAFAFSVPVGATLKDSVPTGPTLKPDSVPVGATLKRTTTPTTSSTPTSTTGAGRREVRSIEAERLRKYLGARESAFAQMAVSADHPETWASAVMGKWGPDGTERPAWRGIEEDRRPEILAAAMYDFAVDGHRYENRHFDGYVRKIIRADRRGDDDRRNESAGGSGGAGQSQALRATGTDGRRHPKAGDRGSGWG